MEEIAGIFNSIGLVLTAILGGFGVISLSVAALLYMNAHGDPQQVNKAKTAAIGAIIGLIMGGMAWVLPGIISRAIVEPSGGQSLTTSGSVQGCDQIFKSQLVAQRQINTAARMNELISTIQNTRDECRPDTWRPKAHDLLAIGTNKADLTSQAFAKNQSCIKDATAGTNAGYAGFKTVSTNKSWEGASVNSVSVPIGLRAGNSGNGVPKPKSGRDSDNNILIFFENVKKLTPDTTARRSNPPGDGASCWLYVARSGVWVSGGASGAEKSS